MNCPKCGKPNESVNPVGWMCDCNRAPEPARPDADSVRVQRIVSLLARWRADADEIEWATKLVGGETKERGKLVADKTREHIAELLAALEGAGEEANASISDRDPKAS